jgi:hypothetical protein
MSDSGLKLKKTLLEEKGLMTNDGKATQSLFFFDKALADTWAKENKETRLSKECWTRMTVNGREFTTRIDKDVIVPNHLRNSDPVYSGKTTQSMFVPGSKY